MLYSSCMHSSSTSSGSRAISSGSMTPKARVDYIFENENATVSFSTSPAEIFYLYHGARDTKQNPGGNKHRKPHILMGTEAPAE